MKHVLDDLTGHLDGALDDAAAERVREHLAACEPCRAERDRLAAAIALLARAPAAPEPSPTFEARFYARLARERAPGRRGVLGLAPWRWLAPGLAGAAAAAVIVWSGASHRRDERFLATHLDLFESYEEVASVGAVGSAEDAAVIAHLDELAGEAP